MKIRAIILIPFIFLFSQIVFAQQSSVEKEIRILIDSYPDLDIQIEYDFVAGDYVVNFSNPYTGKREYLFWCNGSLLPKSELENKSQYWPIIYKYSNVLREPSTMTESEKDRLRQFTSKSNRKNGAGTPMFFFDAVYSSHTRKSLEANLVKTTFLGKPTTVHKRIKTPLKRVEAKIRNQAKKSKEVRVFIEELKSADAYAWRGIEGTNRKSFHSLGIAIDVLPTKYHGGEVFWAWARDKNPKGWMFTPLKRRWIPPKKVRDAFEEEGFIWGGYWAIWDNMHFEYHPELINKMKSEE